MPKLPATGRVSGRHYPSYADLRLRDRIAPGVKVLFVGINPGVRSALTGHHFAGYSNRFWKLLFESGLVSEPITYEEDGRLPEWGFGITNLIARPSPGIDVLTPAEYIEGWHALRKKIETFGPDVVALVGVTLYRAIVPLLGDTAAARPARRSGVKAKPPESILGLRPESIHGARLFVLPNPSGRNANFSYAEMLAAFRALRRYVSTTRSAAPCSARPARPSAARNSRPSRSRRADAGR